MAQLLRDDLPILTIPGPGLRQGQPQALGEEGMMGLAVPDPRRDRAGSAHEGLIAGLGVGMALAVPTVAEALETGVAGLPGHRRRPGQGFHLPRAQNRHRPGPSALGAGGDPHGPFGQCRFKRL
jgi:hypothetical protein